VHILPRNRSRAPLAIAGFIAIPLFFSSLMSSTLALEKPFVVAWNGPDKLIVRFHDPTTANVTEVWLWALVPPLILVIIGLIATRLPYGFYIACASAIVLAMGVVHKTETWQRHHTARFPLGVDNIPASDPASNKYDPGQWEKMARETALSLSHWTIGIALAAIVVMAVLDVRRRRAVRKPNVEPAPLESVHAPDATPPGLGDPVS
jgi:hypothetical protein